MSRRRLETRVLKKIDIPFNVIGKSIKRKLLGEEFVISCCSEQLEREFRLEVNELTYSQLERGKQYLLKNNRILQKYDGDGNLVGEPFVRLCFY